MRLFHRFCLLTSPQVRRNDPSTFHGKPLHCLTNQQRLCHRELLTRSNQAEAHSDPELHASISPSSRTGSSELSISVEPHRRLLHGYSVFVAPIRSLCQILACARFVSSSFFLTRYGFPAIQTQRVSMERSLEALPVKYLCSSSASPCTSRQRFAWCIGTGNSNRQLRNRAVSVRLLDCYLRHSMDSDTLRVSFCLCYCGESVIVCCGGGRARSHLLARPLTGVRTEIPTSRSFSTSPDGRPVL
jgi:hypothetical protein